ncbi:multi-sensor hybrid histidine kinase [Desulfarculus baarsii DSM 2075]|uniref:histidine kinase n=1 Tax=Desulfarculus baarsii (strain ATCC 33931 / DSM 2075 / LMG 7858 / VKM B-1802 / 2st14) TaxID=644282 RepID=E1QD79_DESB2|nr:GAF domain-containing protein [Desulfarculus baarsii]ADK83398.1 multi-sensor hybrid histidine kinase [Desulfarculus baarsii DSM 2075]
MNASQYIAGLRPGPWAVFKKALLIFAPLMVISLAVLAELYHAETAADMVASRRMEMEAATAGQRAIQRVFAPVVDDLRFLAGLVERRLAAADRSAALAELASELTLFAASHPDYDQLRFVDVAGRERARVDRVGGRVKATAPGELQDKSRRYYFRRSIGLGRGGIYVSPLDLNVERERVEQPLKPMIRLAQPVFGPDGHKLGVVVINYLAAKLLEQLRQVGRPAPSALMLLNNQGHWLMGPDPEDEWGFMLPGKEKRTLANAQPQAWREISGREQGQAQTAAGLYSFVTARPLSELRAAGQGEYFWKVVSFLPAGAMSAKAEAWRDWGLLVAAALAFVWGLTAWGLAWAWEQRRATTEALRQANDDLERRVVARTAELSQAYQNARDEMAQRMEAQKALRASEEKYRTMMQAMEDAVYICSEAFVIEYMNPAMIRRLGRDATGELCHQALYHRPDVCPWCVMGVIKKRRHVNYQLDDELYNAVYHVSNDPLIHESGALSKLTVFRDVTKLKEQELALRESAELYHNLFQSMLHGVVYRDAQGRIVSANPAAEKILGIVLQHTTEGLAPESIPELFREDGAAMPPEEHPYEVAMRTGKEVRGVVMGVRNPHTKNVIWITVNAVPLFRPGDEKPHQVFTTFEDVSGQIRDRRVRQARLRLLELSADCDSDTLLQKTIDMAEELTGSEIGFYHFVSEDEKTLQLQVWSSNTLATMCTAKVEKAHYPVDKAGVWVDCLLRRRAVIHNDYMSLPHRRGLPEGHAPVRGELVAPVFRQGRIVAILGVGNKPGDYLEGDVAVVAQLADLAWDIVERKRAQETHARLEDQLRQAQKMEAIGTLAGGIAHDFNNILSAIIGYSELAASDLPEGHPVQEYLEAVLNAGGRAAELIKQILSFSRQAKRERQPVAVTPIVKEVIKLMRASAFGSIEVRQRFSADADLVLADPTSLHQVVMNLCTNARQAMLETGGVLTVELDSPIINAEDAARYDIQQGHFLRLSVSDTGVGMDQATLGRIFEPFFTTKEQGKGTGLGLSVLHGIVKDLGGSIRVYSESGRGSVFQVYLPLLASQAQRAAAPERQALAGGSERIMFVDDEEALVDIGRQILAPLGYEFFGFTSPEQALAAFRAAPDGFDLIFTDQNMPGRSGLEMALEMMRLRPELPVILCSGFSEQVSAEKALELGFKAFLYKPILTSQMVAAIRQALDEARTPTLTAEGPADAAPALEAH